MARLLPDPPSRTGGILTKRELAAALRVLSTLRQPQPATVVLSWDNDMQDILQGLSRTRYVETLPAYRGHTPKPSAPFRPDVLKTTPLGLEYLKSIQTAQSERPTRPHATKKSSDQLDREIATVLAHSTRARKKGAETHARKKGAETHARKKGAETRARKKGAETRDKGRAEELKAEGRALQALGAAASQRQAFAIDRQLREIGLSGIDPFWIRWSAFIDGEGGGRIGQSWRAALDAQYRGREW